MWHALTAPIRALGMFFEISVVGALGYIVGVIGAVFIPGTWKGLRALNVPKPAAIPLAVLLATYGGGLLLLLFMGSMPDMDGKMGIDPSMDVSTHQLALERVNTCPAATVALETPIRRTAIGPGTFETRGAFGTSTWELDVAGPHRSGKLEYSAEMHGGKWALTTLVLRVGADTIDLAECMAGPPPPPVHVSRAELVGVWGTPHGKELVLTRFSDDGTFSSVDFVDDKMVLRFRGTWELADGGALVWHFDRARSTVPQAVWDRIGEARINADRNPIVELNKVHLVIRELDGSTTEMRPMDPARLVDLLRDVDAP